MGRWQGCGHVRAALLLTAAGKGGGGPRWRGAPPAALAAAVRWTERKGVEGNELGFPGGPAAAGFDPRE